MPDNSMAQALYRGHEDELPISQNQKTGKRYLPRFVPDNSMAHAFARMAAKQERMHRRDEHLMDLVGARVVMKTFHRNKHARSKMPRTYRQPISAAQAKMPVERKVKTNGSTETSIRPRQMIPDGILHIRADDPVHFHVDEL